MEDFVSRAAEDLVEEGGDLLSDSEFDRMWCEFSDPEGYAGVIDTDFDSDGIL